MELQPHRTGNLLGHYRIDAFDGASVAGDMYRATDTRTLDPAVQIIVLRVFESAAAEQSDQASPFLRAGELLKHLRHPHLIPVLEHGEVAGQRFVATPHLEGRSLNRVMLDPANRKPARLVRITEAVCREIGAALAYVHQHGVMHGDISISSTFQSNSGPFLLAGIGSAYDFSAADDADARFLLEALENGLTENARGTSVDGRDDLFALGAVLYELATGAPPDTEATHDALLPLLTASALPQALRHVIQTLLQPDPNDRFASAREMLEALDSSPELLQRPVPIPAWTRSTNASRAQQVTHGSARSTDIASDSRILELETETNHSALQSQQSPDATPAAVAPVIIPALEQNVQHRSTRRIAGITVVLLCVVGGTSFYVLRNRSAAPSARSSTPSSAAPRTGAIVLTPAVTLLPVTSPLPVLVIAPATVVLPGTPTPSQSGAPAATVSASATARPSVTAPATVTATARPLATASTIATARPSATVPAPTRTPTRAPTLRPRPTRQPTTVPTNAAAATLAPEATQLPTTTNSGGNVGAGAPNVSSGQPTVEAVASTATAPPIDTDPDPPGISDP